MFLPITGSGVPSHPISGDGSTDVNDMDSARTRLDSITQGHYAPASILRQKKVVDYETTLLKISDDDRRLI